MRHRREQELLAHGERLLRRLKRKPHISPEFPVQPEPDAAEGADLQGRHMAIPFALNPPGLLRFGVGHLPDFAVHGHFEPFGIGIDRHTGILLQRHHRFVARLKMRIDDILADREIRAVDVTRIGAHMPDDGFQDFREHVLIVELGHQLLPDPVQQLLLLHITVQILPAVRSSGAPFPETPEQPAAGPERRRQKRDHDRRRNRMDRSRTGKRRARR